MITLLTVLLLAVIAASTSNWPTILAQMTGVHSNHHTAIGSEPTAMTMRSYPREAAPGVTLNPNIPCTSYNPSFPTVVWLANCERLWSMSGRPSTVVNGCPVGFCGTDSTQATPTPKEPKKDDDDAKPTTLQSSTLNCRHQPLGVEPQAWAKACERVWTTQLPLDQAISSSPANGLASPTSIAVTVESSNGAAAGIAAGAVVGVFVIIAGLYLAFKKYENRNKGSEDNDDNYREKGGTKVRSPEDAGRSEDMNMHSRGRHSGSDQGSVNENANDDNNESNGDARSPIAGGGHFGGHDDDDGRGNSFGDGRDSDAGSDRRGGRDDDDPGRFDGNDSDAESEVGSILMGPPDMGSPSREPPGDSDDHVVATEPSEQVDDDEAASEASGQEQLDDNATFPEPLVRSDNDDAASQLPEDPEDDDMANTEPASPTLSASLTPSYKAYNPAPSPDLHSYEPYRPQSTAQSSFAGTSVPSNVQSSPKPPASGPEDYSFASNRDRYMSFASM